MKRILTILLLISSIPLFNNCAGGGGAAAVSGPNTALVLGPVGSAGSGMVNQTALIVGTGRNAGVTTVAPIWRTAARSGVVLGGALSGAFAFW